MKRLLLSILIVFIGVNCRAQTFNEKSPTDTCILKDIKIKKVLAYRINSVTILVDYKDFMESFTPLWRKFKVGVRSLDRGSEKAIDENPSYLKRFQFLDKTYQRLTKQIKLTDTVYISDIAFTLADVGYGYDFTKALEHGNCIVLDKNNVRQYIILRQKFSYQKDWLDGRGGRAFFIKGERFSFIEGTDWVS